MLFRHARKGFCNGDMITLKSEMVPSENRNWFHYHVIVDLLGKNNIINLVIVEWWFMYGNHTLTSRKLAIKVLSHIIPYLACERNYNTFTLIHIKQQNYLTYPRLQQLIFCYYNMKLKIYNIKTENDNVVDKYYLELLDISIEVDKEKENKLI